MEIDYKKMEHDMKMEAIEREARQKTRRSLIGWAFFLAMLLIGVFMVFSLFRAII